MIVAMGCDEEIGSVATNTLGVRGDGEHQRSVCRVLKLRWCGVAVAAFAGVNCHWIIGLVAADAECCVKDVPQSCCRVVDGKVCCRGCLVAMAVQAIDK